MFVSPNDSPFAGKEGTKLTAAVIKERLFKEAETNVALKVIEDLRSSDSLEIRGRGVLHLGILLEELRREGFELAVSPPKPVLKRDPETKQIMEPIEEATILVDSQYIGVVIEKMTKRKAEILTYDEEDGKVKVVMEVPARGLLGYVSGGASTGRHLLLRTSPFLTVPHPASARAQSSTTTFTARARSTTSSRRTSLSRARLFRPARAA